MTYFWPACLTSANSLQAIRYPSTRLCLLGLSYNPPDFAMSRYERGLDESPLWGKFRTDCSWPPAEVAECPLPGSGNQDTRIGRLTHLSYRYRRPGTEFTRIASSTQPNSISAFPTEDSGLPQEFATIAAVDLVRQRPRQHGRAARERRVVHFLSSRLCTQGSPS